MLRFLDVEGMRASTLAERSGLTRQALTQIVDDLERLGYVTRTPDPEDRRAKLVVYTGRGRAAFAASRRIIASIERDFATRLGEKQHKALREALDALTRDGAAVLRP